MAIIDIHKLSGQFTLKNLSIQQLAQNWILWFSYKSPGIMFFRSSIKGNP